MLLLWNGYLTQAQLDPPRKSGGKLIASYFMSEDGELKKEMSRLRREEIQREEQDEDLIKAIMAWWIND